jgi:signal transduction histidine kinase
MIPLLSRGNALGILEIEASDRSLEVSWEVLEIIGSQLAIVLAGLAQQTLRDEQLDTSMAWTAHELRGPILGVRSVLELLLERAGADPRDPLIIRRSIDELDRLVGTAEAVLGWAVGTRSLQRRRTDIVRIVEEAVESCRLETGQDGIVVSFDRRAVARIDPAHIRAAIANLLRNALAFAEPGTKVEAAVDRSGDMVMVSVKDFGPEIPAIERELIFSPFVRGTAPGRATNGSGLGLFIARRVVEAHGGRIWVESDRESVTFRVLLPVMGKDASGIAS